MIYRHEVISVYPGVGNPLSICFPHLYKLAASLYRIRLVDETVNQTVLISIFIARSSRHSTVERLNLLNAALKIVMTLTLLMATVAFCPSNKFEVHFPIIGNTLITQEKRNFLSGFSYTG